MSEKLQEIFAENVRDLMVDRGWTQLDLAEKLGVTQSYVSQILRGYRRPGLDSLEMFAKAFKIDPSDLIKKLSRT